ncbi:hypothetical protein [Nesterenkonia muleiensis]|uniref:hypothetical protein n=1 Tax=Nesterenkonia muleiensis TaxID=2282648 RepID=UPI000E76F10B|nr:hypothetical protein [Nesterenkonia muleiensis]
MENEDQRPRRFPPFWTSFLSAVTLAFLADVWASQGNLGLRVLIYLALAGPCAYMILRHLAAQQGAENLKALALC